MRLFDTLRRAVGPKEANSLSRKKHHSNGSPLASRAGDGTSAEAHPSSSDSTQTTSPQVQISGPSPPPGLRILFVGGDPLWFRQAERDLRCLEPTWLSQHAEDTPQAQAMFSSNSFDAVVLDAATPEAASL